MIKIKFSVPKEGESLKRKNTGDDSSSSKRQTYHHINDSMKALLKSLKSAKDPLSGRQLSYFFVELPNKEHYPDYYSLIKSPMSINMINRKLDRHEYHSFDDFKYDVNLIFSNARTYNMPESQVCNDANALEIKFKSEFDIAKRESSKENHFNSSSEQDVGRLHQWIIVNNPGNVLSMLSKGADPNEYYRDTQQSGINWNSLHVAAYYNSVEIAGILLDHGADIEAKDSKFLGTPLAWSCYRTNLEVCRLLIERGANKYARNALGQIPLDLLPVRTAEWLELFKEPEPIIKPIKLHLNTNQKSVIDEEEKSEKVVEEIKVLEKVVEAPVKRILRPPPPPVVEAPKKEQVVAVEIPKKQRVIESAPVEVPTVLSSDYPPLPKKRVEKETPILSCLGLVSNDHLLRTVLPPSVYSHSVMVDKKVKSLSLRVVLTTNTDAEKPKVSLMHNDQAVKCIEKVSAKGRLSVGAAHVIDFSTSVHQGLNIFEVFIGEEEEEMETYAIFIERPYL